jgi:hypothetical protein
MPREDLELVLKYRSEAMTPFVKGHSQRIYGRIIVPGQRMPAGAEAAIVSARYQE